MFNAAGSGYLYTEFMKKKELTEGSILQVANDQEALDLAKQIVELDLKRDEYWEDLAALAGDRAFDLLRLVQNR